MSNDNASGDKKRKAIIPAYCGGFESLVAGASSKRSQCLAERDMVKVCHIFVQYLGMIFL
ncbi:hypothetical protein BFW38_05570 [Terasakiispira papahanaumokuakeensis]|uniref:Uncharacterized protein n=1 Tax=Terasakiispira papahanaumokuakeensis TaxID=197479 RepID=A0A1E2V850_9GAMM|nr:hypothetical protein BFW38_05570 [Terasakiispira papahanaumokuakeensis]